MPTYGNCNKKHLSKDQKRKDNYLKMFGKMVNRSR